VFFLPSSSYPNPYAPRCTQILFGDDDQGGADGDGTPTNQAFDAVAFMSPFAYRGFAVDGKQSFWAVYGEAFAEIDRQEAIAAKRRVGKASGGGGAQKQEFVARPAFGGADAPDGKVQAFYAAWRSFATRKTFAWKDEWDTRDAPARRVRRAMEKENTKKRSAAKRKFVDSIHNLVRFVSRRDPRVKAYRERELKAREEREAKMAADRAARKDEKRRLMDEWRVENSRKEAERQRAEAEAIAAGEAPLEREFNLTDELIGSGGGGGGGVGSGDSDSNSDSDSEGVGFGGGGRGDIVAHHECVACKKIFKSEKQWENHQKSKKHKAAVKQLRRELEQDDALVGEGPEDIKSREARAKQKQEAEAAAVAAPESEDSESEEEEEEEEEVVVKKSLSKKQRRKLRKFEEMERKLEEMSLKKMNKKKKKKKKDKKKKTKEAHGAGEMRGEGGVGSGGGQSSGGESGQANKASNVSSKGGDGSEQEEAVAAAAESEQLSEPVEEKKLTKKQIRRAKSKRERQEKERLEREKATREKLAEEARKAVAALEEDDQDDERTVEDYYVPPNQPKKKKKKKKRQGKHNFKA
jgi:DnaJ family protein A protein 5